MIAAIYLRNTVRLAGLLAVVVGLILIGYQWWVVLHGDTMPMFYLCSSPPAHVTHWLVHASPVLQRLLGWPWVVVVEVPLPLLLLGGGALAMRV
jgi:hypothetical protein